MLLYRIESRFGPAWDPVKIRLDGAHNFAALTEWHETLAVAIEYAEREQKKDAERYQHESHRRYQFRVTDHLGAVHWKGEGVQ
jgi:hypothetical protein